MSEFDELERAVASLSKSIADFPVGAISLNDLKPTEEKIQDLRESLKGLNTRILMLRAKAEAQKSLSVPEESEQESYDELTDAIAHWTINNKVVETCLQNAGAVEILESLQDTEINRTLKAIMRKLYTLNDMMIGLDQSRTPDMTKETELKWQLQKSLFEFSDFLKEQEGVRKKKFEETNPEIARQKESMQTKLQKINIMKRLIMNFIGASNDIVKENPMLKTMMENHRELVDLEAVVKMAQETRAEDS